MHSLRFADIDEPSIVEEDHQPTLDNHKPAQCDKERQATMQTRKPCEPGTLKSRFLVTTLDRTDDDLMKIVIRIKKRGVETFGDLEGKSAAEIFEGLDVTETDVAKFRAALGDYNISV